MVPNSLLSMQEAAGLLNVSRPYLIRLLEEKKIPFAQAGTRRRILFQDLMAYKAKIDNERRKTLDELAEEAQNLGWDIDNLEVLERPNSKFKPNCGIKS